MNPGQVNLCVALNAPRLLLNVGCGPEKDSGSRNRFVLHFPLLPFVPPGSALSEMSCILAVMGRRGKARCPTNPITLPAERCSAHGTHRLLPGSPLLALPPFFAPAGAQREESICTRRLSCAKGEGGKAIQIRGEKKSKGTTEMKNRPFYNITLDVSVPKSKGIGVIFLTWLRAFINGRHPHLGSCIIRTAR